MSTPRQTAVSNIKTESTHHDELIVQVADAVRTPGAAAAYGDPHVSICAWQRQPSAEQGRLTAGAAAVEVTCRPAWWRKSSPNACHLGGAAILSDVKRRRARRTWIAQWRRQLTRCRELVAAGMTPDLGLRSRGRSFQCCRAKAPGLSCMPTENASIYHTTDGRGVAGIGVTMNPGKRGSLAKHAGRSA